MAPFADSIDHLRAELARLDVLLQRELTIARLAAPKDTEDEFRGLVITEGEIDALAQQPDYLDARWRIQEASADALRQLDERAATLRREIDARCVESRDSGVRLALVDLAERTDLSRPEVDLLLLAVAPELEPHYETLNAYIQNDVTRKRPSVDLALNVISRSAHAKFASRWYFRPAGHLRANRLITLAEEPFDRHPSLLKRFLKVEEGVAAALLDQWTPVDAKYEFVPPARGEPRLDGDPVTRESMEALVQRLRTSGLSVVRVVGDSAESLREAATWIASGLQRPLLIGAVETFERDSEQWSSYMQNAIVGNCVIALTAQTEDETEQERRDEDHRRFWRELRAFNGTVLLLGEAGAFREIPGADALWHLDVPRLSFVQRRDEWRRAVGPSVRDEDVARLADSFHFGRTGVARAMTLAAGLAETRHPRTPTPALVDLLDAGRMLTTPQLRRFAVHVEPRFTWDDIVLSRDKTAQLRRIASWKRLRHQVYEDWGFGQKLSRGKGLNVLFSGPSGTGKTMAAEVLAGDLSLDMFQIDLSSVVSKYVGQTEKHLDAIFREAADTQSLLFFDEADALFGKRTEVKDAHDRYANIEINFLLQRIEQFDGIVILATNMRRNLDDAFVRRLTDVVDFTYPEEKLRERIWRGHFPRDEVCESDVDFAFLARQFKLTGGNIKNIVLDAAFRAAEEQRRIGMRHLMLATKAELQKEGKLPTRSEFDRYYELIQPETPKVKLVGC